MNQDPFKEYIKESEPAKRDKGYAWHTAIGLQAVDGLKTSEYLVHTAIRNIEGEISFEEANVLLQTYYEENPSRDALDRTEEADKVSARIAALLSERAFSFTPNEYISIHRKLFTGIYSHAGRIRDYNITKREWVLSGATVLYGSATELMATLDYDFSEEKKFSYKNLSMDEIIHHLAFFISRLWQIHVFGEGNTRTTAVFFIKYLRTLGFEVTNMKVLVSACIMGENCKYNGKNNKNSAAIHFLKDKEVISICPEVLAGMETPRPCAEIVNGRVVDENGNDVSLEYNKAVAVALSKIQNEEIDLVILQSRSPTCGVNQIYDGSFTGKLVSGMGLFAKALKQKGYHVIDVEEI